MVQIEVLKPKDQFVSTIYPTANTANKDRNEYFTQEMREV